MIPYGGRTGFPGIGHRDNVHAYGVPDPDFLTPRRHELRHRVRRRLRTRARRLARIQIADAIAQTDLDTNSTED